MADEVADISQEEERQRNFPTEPTSALSRTGDQGQSSLTISQEQERQRNFPLSPPEEKPPEKPVERPVEKPEERPPAPTGQIFGRTTIFHYTHDGKRDSEHPDRNGFFGSNLDDPSLVGAAVPVEVLEAQFGKFTQEMPDGTYGPLNTPEAREIIQRIRSSHVRVDAPDERQIEVPIVDIQTGHKKERRALDLTLGAWKQMGLKDDTYLSYSVVGNDGSTINANADWSDSSPLARFYKEGGKELAGRADSEILAAAKSRIAPDMPLEDYERAMRDPQGENDLKKYKVRPKQPGEELASIQDSPYFGLGPNDLVKKYYSDLVKAGTLDPSRVDLTDIHQRLFPNAGPIEAFSQFFDAGSEARAAFGREFSKEIHAEAGNIYGLPQALTDFGNTIMSPPVKTKADDWINKNWHLDDLYKQFMGWFMGMANAQKAQAQVDAERAQRAEQTPAGKVGGIVGGGVGQFVAQAPTLGLGAPAKEAAIAVGLYQGLSTFGREVATKGQAQALVDALGSGGVGGIWRFGMNSPAGFWTLFGTSWLADTGEDTLQKWHRGEKIDPVDFGIHSVFDLTSSAIFAKLAPKEETFERKGVAPELKTQEEAAAERSALARHVLGPEVSEGQVWHAHGPLVTRLPERETFTPGELSLAAGELPSGASTEELARQAGLMKPPPAKGDIRLLHLADPEAGLKEKRNTVIRSETKSMLEAKDNGENAKAAEHADRALAHHETSERKEIGKQIADYTEKFTDNGATPGEEPKEPLSEVDRTMIRHHTGLGSLETLEERPIDDAAEIERHLHVEGLEKDKPLEELPELHAGLSFAPVVRGIRRIGKWAYERDPVLGLREKLDPGSFGIGGRTTEAIVRKSRLEAETTLGQKNAEMAHDHRMNELLRGGEKVAVRQRFFAKFPRSVQRAMLVAWEKGQHVGNNFAQEIFKFHDAFYKEIEKLEKAFGFKYDAKDNYIYHLIKGGKEARDRFERWFNNKIAADPRWTHRRTYSQLEDLFKAGFELETYNPEELLQRRFFSSQMAINKVAQLREMERANLAWNVKRPGLTRAVKELGGSQGELIRRAPNGERYYVRKEAQHVLTNAWDMSNLYSNRFFGPTFKALAIAKANSMGIKLFGFTHARHLGLTMNLTSFGNAILQAGIHGKVTPTLVAREFSRLTEGLVGNSAEVKFLRTGKGYDSFSLDQKERIRYWQKGGANIRNTEAQQASFLSWADQALANGMEKLGVARGARPVAHGVATLLNAGYEAATFKPIVDWQFHSFIPQLKWNHFQGLVDNLLRNHPELLETKNEWKLGRELTKLGKETDNRFGEMGYNNLLWPKTWKQLGQNLLLSMTWNYGGVRMYGGAIHDTTALAGKFLEDHQILTKDDLSERMTFVWMYHTINILQGAMINYAAVSAWNYMHPDKKQDPVPKGSLLPTPDSDFYFPRTGDLDDRGRPKRLAPVEYPREIALWLQHVQEQGLAGGTATMVQHKMNPVLSTFLEEMQNQNFYGKEIYDPNDPVLKQLQDRALHILQGTVAPISTSYAPPFNIGPVHVELGQRTPTQRNWFDVAWSMFGFPPASKRATATAAENMIYDTRHRLQGTKRTDIDNQKYAQYDALRQAIKNKDGDAQRQARDQLWKLGVSDKYLKGFETHLKKHPDEKPDENIWKALPHDEHKKLLLRFSPEDRRTYYRMLTPEGQESVLRIMKLESPGEVKFFWSITDEKTLRKLNAEAIRHHESAVVQ